MPPVQTTSGLYSSKCRVIVAVAISLALAKSYRLFGLHPTTSCPAAFSEPAIYARPTGKSDIESGAGYLYLYNCVGTIIEILMFLFQLQSGRQPAPVSNRR